MCDILQGKMLPIKDALRLIQVLAPYIPDELDDNVFSFAGKILDSIIDKGRHMDYLRATYLVSGIDPDDLVKLNVEEVFGFFVKGLVENEILTLLGFYQELRK